jgi:hypothetical protein
MTWGRKTGGRKKGTPNKIKKPSALLAEAQAEVAAAVQRKLLSALVPTNICSRANCCSAGYHSGSRFDSLLGVIEMIVGAGYSSDVKHIPATHSPRRALCHTPGDARAPGCNGPVAPSAIDAREFIRSFLPSVPRRASNPCYVVTSATR